VSFCVLILSWPSSQAHVITQHTHSYLEGVYIYCTIKCPFCTCRYNKISRSDSLPACLSLIHFILICLIFHYFLSSTIDHSFTVCLWITKLVPQILFTIDCRLPRDFFHRLELGLDFPELISFDFINLLLWLCAVDSACYLSPF